MPDKSRDKAKVEALIAASDLSPMLKGIYSEVLAVDPAILRDTGAYETAQGVRRIGAAYFLDDQGNLRDIYSFDFTPQTIDALARSAKRREMAATLTTGADLFKKLRDELVSFKDLDGLCEAAPIGIKRQYITAVSRVFTVEKPKTVLQQMVNYATGIGQTHDDQHDPYSSGYSWRRSFKDRIDNGLSYIAKALELKPSPKGSDDRNPHPVIFVLGEFVRALPKGERFEVDPPVAQAVLPKTLDEKLAKPLSHAKQEEADALKDMLFGKGWREKQGLGIR